MPVRWPVKAYPITGDTLTFGRGSDNDIILDDTQVSRNHARLIRQADEVIIEDLGSTNGTLVNGKPVVGQHVLQPADIISIGSSVFGVKGFCRAPYYWSYADFDGEKTFTVNRRAAATRAAPRRQPASPSTCSSQPRQQNRQAEYAGR